MLTSDTLTSDTYMLRVETDVALCSPGGATPICAVVRSAVHFGRNNVNVTEDDAARKDAARTAATLSA